ncbi:MAG TPA: MBL fold metallo-hydrolase [Thermoanaerobaculia bacterium]|nr:MBL fold metallo-hydrolase [Thermoanaerobaculia bacterium]
MRKTLRIAAAFALAALPAVAQQRDFSTVEIKAIPVAGNIYMLEGAGGNIGVSVGKDGLLIVDDQFAPLADKIKAALKGLGDGKLQFVLNTHWHGDHTGGNEAFGREAHIIAHENVRKRLAAGQMLRGTKVDPAPAGALPVVTFGDSVSIHFNGEEIKAIHFPKGHTDGDSIIFFTGANVLHMGDQFFVGRFPFVDMESGGTVQGLIENTEKVLAQIPANAKIIPGHGAVSTVEDLKSYHRMLIETTGLVRKGMAAVKTLDQLKAEGLPEQWKDWGSGFINTEAWITTIHASYTPGEHTHADGTHH